MKEYYVFKKEDIQRLMKGKPIKFGRLNRGLPRDLPEYMSRALVGVFTQDDLEALDHAVKLRRSTESTYEFL